MSKVSIFSLTACSPILIQILAKIKQFKNSFDIETDFESTVSLGKLPYESNGSQNQTTARQTSILQSRSDDMNIMKMINKFFLNKRGNVVITFSLAFIPIMLSVGAAIDYSRSANLHSRIARATDAALLAAVSNVMNEVDMDDIEAVNERLNEDFEPFFLANMYDAEDYDYNGFEITYVPGTLGVNVKVFADYNAVVFPVVGLEGWKTDVFAAAKMRVKAGGAVSMFLVLDRSGSMAESNGGRRKDGKRRSGKKGGGNNETKMESLQTAVNTMTINLKAADPEEKYLRMGAVAYSSYMWPHLDIKWDLDEANAYVQNMESYGGTDSSDAIDKAYTQLIQATEQSEHQNKSGQTPKLVIVFMTDGDNNYSGDDTSTINTCDTAKAHGVEIYTVAFMAPRNGEALLSNCASSDSHYFEPQNNDDLIEAFKSIGDNVAESLVLTQ